jgi:hypothetical protein
MLHGSAPRGRQLARSCCAAQPLRHHDQQVPHHGGRCSEKRAELQLAGHVEVRPIPPGDPDFQHLYRGRNDAESINRALDDTLFLRRAHSVGHQRQHLNLITYALTVNSLAIHRHGRGSVDPPDRLAA